MGGWWVVYPSGWEVWGWEGGGGGIYIDWSLIYYLFGVGWGEYIVYGYSSLYCVYFMCTVDTMFYRGILYCTVKHTSLCLHNTIPYLYRLCPRPLHLPPSHPSTKERAKVRTPSCASGACSIGIFASHPLSVVGHNPYITCDETTELLYYVYFSLFRRVTLNLLLWI